MAWTGEKESPKERKNKKREKKERMEKIEMIKKESIEGSDQAKRITRWKAY